MIGSKIMLALSAAGLGFGYSIERAEQGASLVSFAPRCGHPGYQGLVSTMKRKGFTIEGNPLLCRPRNVVCCYTWGQPAVKICTNQPRSVRGHRPAEFEQAGVQIGL